MNKEDVGMEKWARALQKRMLSCFRAQQCGQLQSVMPLSWCCEETAAGANMWWPHRVWIAEGPPYSLAHACSMWCRQACARWGSQRIREELVKQKKEEQTRTPLL